MSEFARPQNFIKQPELSSPDMYIVDFETLQKSCPAERDITHLLSEYCRDESCWD